MQTSPDFIKFMLCMGNIFCAHFYLHDPPQHANDIPTRGVHQVGYKRFPPTRQNIQQTRTRYPNIKNRTNRTKPDSKLPNPNPTRHELSN